MKRVMMYSPYERFWHWTQAGAIFLLVATGLGIHWPDALAVGGFQANVVVHLICGVLLLVNGALGLFYQLTTGGLRDFMPPPRDFLTLAIKQARYYGHGIFVGAPHPFQRRKGQKMNVIQQLTYLGILNVLLPGQIVLGLLMALSELNPAVSAAVGGLVVLGPLHTLLAWLFVAFVIGHIYMTTTGPTPLAYLKSMITGWEDVHE